MPDDVSSRRPAPASREGRQGWLIPAEGELSRNLVADVAVATPRSRVFSYGVPTGLQTQVVPGVMVRVPYGKAGREVDGLCVRVTQRDWDHTYKPIIAVSPVPPLLTEPLLELGQWLATYYFTDPWRAFAAMVPLRARRARKRRVTYLRRTDHAPDALTPAQQRLYDALGEPRERRAALSTAGVGPGVLQALKRQGLVESETRQESVAEPPPPLDFPSGAGRPQAENHYALTPGQQAALAGICDALTAQQFGVFALFGVPGSGKTEVYVRAIRQAVAAGRQAILIVPEIALATQVVTRLARRFERVVVMHSQLTDRTRADTLRHIRDGHVDVVIGTRTAVFAPCTRLGLLVVDEEQEGSLKNLANPFFHARDVAVKRGQLEGVPVVLGSATPSLETWHNAQHMSHYTLLPLPDRVPGAVLPTARAVRVDSGSDGGSLVLSRGLINELRQTLAARQQAILLHNRRGYAQFVRCSRCGTIVSCPRCDIRLVLHHERDDTPGPAARPRTVLKCHQCGRQQAVPAMCPDGSCGGKLVRSGLAIQRLEEELRRIVPDARLLRLDSDTMKHRDQYRAALDRFEAGEADILLGTQMVAKGLDFPGVRLVGVIDADAALWLPDFRAGERVFQLLMQVVGRAGRKEGESLALVQCGDPRHPAVRCALEMNYLAFADDELAARTRLFYPPVARLVRLVVADSRPGVARNAAADVAAVLREFAPRVHPRILIDDATPCVIPRVRELLRHQVTIRGPRDDSIQRLLREVDGVRRLRPNVHRFTVDVDALDLL